MGRWKRYGGMEGEVWWEIYIYMGGGRRSKEVEVSADDSAEGRI